MLKEFILESSYGCLADHTSLVISQTYIFMKITQINGQNIYNSYLLLFITVTYISKHLIYTKY